LAAVNFGGQVLAQSNALVAIEKFHRISASSTRNLAKNGTITRYLHTNPPIKNRIDSDLHAK